MTGTLDQQRAPHDITKGMREVELTAIEPELDNLWREENANALASGSHAESRNSVLTLVCFAGNDVEAELALRVVEKLGAIHPSRAIVVDARSALASESEPVRAFVSTRSQWAGGAKSYGETILITAPASAVRHLPGTVLPLIVSGLPAFLWWTGEPPWGSEQLEAMVDGCDRLIVDSSEMAHPEGSLVALEDLLRRKASSCVVSDFNWTRQEPWRELVAQFFDGPETQPYLWGIDRLSIEYAAGSEDRPANAAQAYIFAGWMASRLNWRFQSSRGRSGEDEGAQHLLKDGDGHNLTIEVTPRYGVPIQQWLDITSDDDPDRSSPSRSRRGRVGPGALMSVYLHSRSSGNEATFAIAREADLEHASTLCQIAGSAPPSQTVHLPSLGEAAVLTEQLKMIGHDTVYEDALTMAALLIGPQARRAFA